MTNEEITFVIFAVLVTFSMFMIRELSEAMDDENEPK